MAKDEDSPGGLRKCIKEQLQTRHLLGGVAAKYKSGCVT